MMHRSWIMKMPGNNRFRIIYEKRVIKHDIPSLPKTMRSTIKTAIEERIVVDPVGFGKPLQYSLRGHRRLRVGRYRIIYKIEPAQGVIKIFAIKHRKDVYDFLHKANLS